ncbi:ABC transporter substrate-binding protein [Ornithinibacillus sp. 4-3]|uniref:ABC transporter substrate-binding protein n=1 Tax=Ornithinibacillus sp. 4-3 TaxID=3231488 RepID=A0AB39HT07_9BACI
MRKNVTLKNKSKIIFSIFSVMLALFLVACSDSDSGEKSSNNGNSTASGSETGSDTPLKNMEELKIGAQTLPSTLDANASVSNAGIQVYYNIYDTLIMREPHAEELEFIPGLAEEWEQTDDLTWELKLRADVKFHDGTTMTAEDVAYSLNRVINEEDPSYATSHAYLLANIEEAEVVDDLTVRLHTFKPEPLMEHLLSDPNAGISAKAYSEEVGLDKASLEPVTTGPYKVTSFEPDQSIVLERFEDYWGEEAPFEKVTFTLIPEISSRATALQNNEVDFVTSIPADQEQIFEGNDSLRLIGTTYPMYHIYRFNMSNPIVADPNVRAALDYAIDRQTIVDTIWEGKAEAATSFQFEDYGEPLYLSDVENIEFDLEKAKELIAASDYDGETIEIYNTTNYYTYADLAAQTVIEMWKEIGVNAQLVEVESLSSVPNEEKEIRTWSNPLYYIDPMGVIERHWSPVGESVNSGDFIPSDEYIEQFEIARYSADENERADALRKMQEFYREETPYIYLYKPYEAIAMKENINYEIPSKLRAHTLGLRAGEISVNSTQ